MDLAFLRCPFSPPCQELRRTIGKWCVIRAIRAIGVITVITVITVMRVITLLVSLAGRELREGDDARVCRRVTCVVVVRAFVFGLCVK